MANEGVALNEIDTTSHSSETKPTIPIPQFLLDDIKKDPIETIPDVASFEFVGEDDSAVKDIQFSQNGHTSSVREEFPGDYTIFLLRTTQASAKKDGIYNHYTGGRNEMTLTLIEDNPGDFCVTTLHEAGHAVDEKTDEKQNMDNEEKKSLVRSQVMDTLDGIPLVPEEVKAKMIGAARFSVLAEEGQEEFFSSLEKEYSTYSTLSPEERKELAVKIGAEHLAFRRECILSQERSAWLHALRGVRALRRKGINVYGGSEAELVTMIAQQYSTYEEMYKPDEPKIPSPTRDDHRSRLRDIRITLSKLPNRITSMLGNR